ncbi:tetratricopeptide repeat protein [Pedosphaera parvula]|uniref:Tetratricopeptide TPR_2 repeat protein n=1 Tax=Pedosphaera parvula (strain Ellin514) TaxID=320771 RepID=B9XCR1_PEDPL|nr:tetratricopeptide repeat protein [Pedosphaera parvula]EEF62257.1 Tetratricopeptide TPR_2 repeat protein [Pedosphaera parvula Ellin514]
MIRRCFWQYVLGALFLFAVQAKLLAHGDLHGRIAALTIQINAETNNPQLYLERGELHRLHEEWEGALADFNRAAALDPTSKLAELGRGRALLGAGNPKEALLALEIFLKAFPHHIEARLTYARALSRLNRPAEAAENFSQVIQLTPDPMPDYYLERARMLVLANRLDEALNGLDEGIKRTKAVASLQLPAIDLEIQQKHFDEALSRLDQLSALAPRKEAWAARRGEILELADRTTEARAAYMSGLAWLQDLAPARRQTRMMVELDHRLREGLERSETKEFQLRAEVKK